MININQVTKQAIIDTELPQFGKTYCVIPNRDIINTAENSFSLNGLKILNERFRATYSNQICTGTYILDYSKDENYNLVFAFTNSYNKQKRFESGIGVSVSIDKRTAEGTENVKIPIISKVSNWKRKHTGTANIETYQMIDSQIMDYTSMYDSVMEDLRRMEGSCITKLDFAHMLGEMFVEGVISSSQLNIVFNEFKSPRLFKSIYDEDNDCANLYKVYVSICYALMEDHPTTYLQNLSAVHAHCLAYCNNEMTLDLKDEDTISKENTMSVEADPSTKTLYPTPISEKEYLDTLEKEYLDTLSDDEKVKLTEYYNQEEKEEKENIPFEEEQKGSDSDIDLFSQVEQPIIKEKVELPTVEEKIEQPTIEENDVCIDNDGYHISQVIEFDGNNLKVKGFVGDLAICQLC